VSAVALAAWWRAWRPGALPAARDARATEAADAASSRAVSTAVVTFAAVLGWVPSGELARAMLEGPAPGAPPSGGVQRV
jgi:hypothetical protein